jgi:DNA-binding GntR family transcriptional regulator
VLPFVLVIDQNFFLQENHDSFIFSHYTDCNKEIICKGGSLLAENKVFKIGRLRLIDDFPIALHTSFVTKSTFPEIEKDGPDITSMFQYYRQHGFVEFGSSTSTLNVIFPTLFERDILQCSSLIPLLQVESLCRDKQSNQGLEHTVIIYRSDCYTYVI